MYGLITTEFEGGYLVGSCLNRPDGTWQLFWTRHEAEQQAREEGLIPAEAERCPFCGGTGITPVSYRPGDTKCRACQGRGLLAL